LIDAPTTFEEAAVFVRKFLLPVLEAMTQKRDFLPTWRAQGPWVEAESI
jgi:hypothetical protein